MQSIQSILGFEQDIGLFPNDDAANKLSLIDFEDRFTPTYTYDKLFNSLRLIETQLLDKVAILHNAGIFHLDIRPKNIAICLDQDIDSIKFTHWDLACMTPKTIKLSYHLITEDPEFENFYVQNAPEFDLSLIIHNFRSSPRHSLLSHKMLLCKLIDLTCVYSIILKLWLSIDTMVYNERKSSFLANIQCLQYEPRD